SEDLAIQNHTHEPILALGRLCCVMQDQPAGILPISRFKQSADSLHHQTPSVIALAFSNHAFNRLANLGSAEAVKRVLSREPSIVPDIWLSLFVVGTMKQASFDPQPWRPRHSRPRRLHRRGHSCAELSRRNPYDPPEDFR